jgi:hypothetical protein
VTHKRNGDPGGDIRAAGGGRPCPGIISARGRAVGTSGTPILDIGWSGYKSAAAGEPPVRCYMSHSAELSKVVIGGSPRPHPPTPSSVVPQSNRAPAAAAGSGAEAAASTGVPGCGRRRARRSGRHGAPGGAAACGTWTGPGSEGDLYRRFRADSDAGPGDSRSQQTSAAGASPPRENTTRERSPARAHLSSFVSAGLRLRCVFVPSEA